MINFKTINQAIAPKWDEFNSFKLPFEEYEWTKSFIEKYHEFVRRGLLWYDITVEEKKAYYEKLMDLIYDSTSILYAHIRDCVEENNFDNAVNTLINDVFKLQACIEDFAYEEEDGL